MITEKIFIEDFRELVSTQNEVWMETDLLDIDEWDSYSAMAFITMIKEKYNIELQPFSVAEAVFVEDLYNLIKGR